jgi:ubiquitin fusion degradation protein 1
MQVGGRQVPAALTLPFGNLFFGYDNLRPPPGSAAALALAATPTVVPFAGVGSGNTLSGRAARAAPAPVATPIAPAPAAAPVGSFGGKGQSMSGRKPIETITIDD